MRWRGDDISVDFFLFVSLYNTKFMNNLILMCVFELLEKITTLTTHIPYDLQNLSTFFSEERLVNLVRRGECLVRLSSY